MGRGIKQIREVIIGTIAEQIETPLYGREVVAAGDAVLKYVAGLTYRDFATIKKNVEVDEEN